MGSAPEVYWAVTMLGDPNQAVGIGAMGCVFALGFANLGAAFGTARGGVSLMETTAIRPDIIFKAIIPIVMAGILGMYGLIITIILKQGSKFHCLLLIRFYNSLVYGTPITDYNSPEKWNYSWNKAYRHMGSGLCVGLSCFASGMAIGTCGDAGIRGLLHGDILIAVILMMIFAEAIALFGFIVGVVLAQ